MPPEVTWFAGRELIGRFLQARVLTEPGRFQMIPVAANGQPALAAYLRGHDGEYRAHSIGVLTIAASRITRVTSFPDPELFAVFGLPRTAHAAAAVSGTGPMTPAAPTAWPAEAPGCSSRRSATRSAWPWPSRRISCRCPTPCGEWDLRMLLRHASESLTAFGEGIEAGRVGLRPGRRGRLYRGRPRPRVPRPRLRAA